MKLMMNVSCGACEAICPDVFTVPDKMVVNESADFSAYESEIQESVDSAHLALSSSPNTFLPRKVAPHRFFY